MANRLVYTSESGVCNGYAKSPVAHYFMTANHYDGLWCPKCDYVTPEWRYNGDDES